MIPLTLKNCSEEQKVECGKKGADFLHSEDEAFPRTVPLNGNEEEEFKSFKKVLTSCILIVRGFPENCPFKLQSGQGSAVY